ncbi:ATP-binding protein [Kitasatospora phosalacinea]|uniref:ATP-binding protein n=1 Tax=Kitasatospora phosalacinea TaxID=2065 RepID=UPI0006923E20|nr:ATP-binding protein [Kitasatospora phosalacinea]
MDLPDEVHQQVRAVAGFAYGAIGADIHVFGDGTPVYLLYARDPRGGADGLRRDSAWLRAQPSRMLDARSEIVEFTGREAELDRLRAWRDQPARTAVRWLHGPGGAGKSRLAARFAAECADTGWLVVDAVHGTDTHPPAEGSQDLRTDRRAGVLVLVDYADRWPDAHLAWLFHNGLLRGQLPARVLLIARSVRPWPALRAQLGRLRRPTDLSDQPLDPLADSGHQGERARMFEAARRGFAAHYPDPDALEALRPPHQDLARPEFGLTLAVHMAALTAVDARAAGREPPGDLAGMTAYLLDREHENWRRPDPRTPGAPDAAADDRRGLDLARTVFTAVLTGPMRRDAARPLLDRLLLRTPADHALTAHAVHYPPTDPAAANVLEPLLPDRLAEDYLALTLPGSPVTGYPTDLWSVTGTTRILGRDGAAAPPWTPRALTFLVAAAERWPHVGPAVLFPLLRRDPALAVRAGSAVLAALAALDPVDLDVLEAVEPLASPRDVRVESGAAALAARLATHRLETATDPVRRARLLTDLAAAHLRAERRNDALALVEEAVRLTRAAARQDPAHRPRHAAALLRLGGLFPGEIGAERQAALLREAIGLLEQDPADDTAPVSLVQAHTRLALALQQTGDTAAAHASVAEARRLLDGILDRDPLRYLALATDVNHLEAVHGYLLAESGRSAEAAEGAGRTVEFLTGMARLHPAGHGEGLADALHVQSLHLWDAGRHAESVDALLKSVRLHRQLAEVDPRFRRPLAARLDEAAAKLISLERHAEAAAVAEESLALHRERLARLPDTADGRDAAEAEHRAIGTALHYLRTRRGADRLAWGTPAEIDAAAERLVRAADPAGLWDLMRAVPVTDALRIAHRHPPAHWAPPEDPRGLVARLTARRHRPRAAERTARAAAESAVWHLPGRGGRETAGPTGAGPLSFAPGGPGRAPVMARETRLPGGTDPDGATATRIDVYDLGSRSVLWSADHRRTGPAAVACLGADAVLALRPRPYRAGPELVRYGPSGAEVLAHGPALDGARLLATAHVFAVLPRGTTAALIGTHDGRPEQVDLYDRLGLEQVTVHALDPSGELLLLADRHRVLLADAALRPLSADGWWRVPEQHGTVESAVFLSSEEFVTAASTGGAYLFQRESDRVAVTAWHVGPPLEDLVAVPGWRVVAGRSRDGARTHFHDAVALAPVPAPRPLAGGPRGRAPLPPAAPPGGRHVVHGSTVHDLGDPLSFADRPLASLTPADLRLLGAHLDRGRAPSAAVRELLELVRDLASPV